MSSTVVKKIYFAPTFCSDLTLVYGQTEYHVHRFVLARESKYFEALLEPNEKERRIELLPVPTHNEVVVAEESFEQWLNLLYRPKPPLVGECFVPEIYEKKTAELVYYDIAALSHYFQCTRLEPLLEAIWSYFGCNNENRVKWFWFLQFAMKYHWANALEDLQNMIASYLLYIRKMLLYQPQQWFQLTPAMRENILEKFVTLRSNE